MPDYRGKVRVWVATGGSFGHVMPAFRFVSHAQKKCSGIRWFLSVDKEIFANHQAKEMFDSHYTIKAFPYKGFKSLIAPLFWKCLIKSVIDSCRIMQKENISLLLTFGGFSSIPQICAAFIKRIPVVFHEQNVELGLANRLANVIATRGWTTFSHDKLGKSNKIIKTGFPMALRDAKNVEMSLLNKVGIDTNKKTVLIFGGSQGAQFLTDLTEEICSDKSLIMPSDCQVILLSGRSTISSKLKQMKDDGAVCIFEWFDDMPALYALADIVVCRAGSATLHEIASYKKNAILIPYPHSKSHQVKNAQHLERLKGAWCLTQDQVTAKRIISIISQIFNTTENRGKRCSEILDYEGEEKMLNDFYDILDRNVQTK